MAIIPSRDLAQQIANLLKQTDGVTQLEELQAHRFGPHVVLNLTIGIDGALSVYEGDRIATSVEEVLLTSIPNVRRVHVHYHPAEADHANMSIDEILEPERIYKAPRHPEYYE
jgi:divalent metal cation (Fe/Co/Zn/Cd) transporter